MKQLLFPWVAFRYDKKLIEIREWVRVEKSEIIHCAMAWNPSQTINEI